MAWNAQRLQIFDVGLCAAFRDWPDVIDFFRLCSASCGLAEPAQLIARLRHVPTPELLPGVSVSPFCGGSAFGLWAVGSAVA
jgi:hypothetical protein